jgi:hypothetical protein
VTSLEFAVLFLYHLEQITASRALELLRTEEPKLEMQHIRLMYDKWKDLHPELEKIVVN